MRLTDFYAIPALLFSMIAFAQEPMPMGGGHMDMPMTATPMPKKVDDNRKIVPLTEPERAIVMAQMRQMLASVQGITDGLARGDFPAVSAAASKSGMGMMQGVPSQIRMKFPAAFKQMGMASHRVFDQIAQESKTGKDAVPVLKQLSEAMQNCVACHATYRFAPPK